MLAKIANTRLDVTTKGPIYLCTHRFMGGYMDDTGALIHNPTLVRAFSITPLHSTDYMGYTPLS